MKNISKLELALNNSTVGEVVKELVDDIEINESKE